MQALVSSLTAGLLFIHTIFGCCWHHAHVCEHQPFAVASSSPGCCQHHHHHDGNHSQSDGSQHEQPGKCQVKCHGTCQYTAPQKVQIDSPLLSSSLDFVTAVAVIGEADFASVISWELARSSPLAAPPLRLHLLHQLLLI